MRVLHCDEVVADHRRVAVVASMFQWLREWLRSASTQPRVWPLEDDLLLQRLQKKILIK